MEAIGLAFGVWPVIVDGVKQCRAAYGFYKDTKRFGIDYNIRALKVRGEMARLRLFETMCAELVSGHRGYQDDPLVRDVQLRLALMKDIFAACHEIQAKYQGQRGDAGDEGDQGVDISTSISDEINIPTICLDPDPTPSDRIQERRKRHRGFFANLNLPLPHSPRSRSRSSSSSTSHPPSPTTSISSQEQTENSLVLTQPTDLDDVSSTMHGADQRRQDSAKLRDRIAWVDHSKEEMDKMIQELIEHNDFLLKIIQIAPSHNSNIHLPGQSPIQQSSRLARDARSLERLHRQLRASNRSSNPVRFAFKLDFEELAKQQVEVFLDRRFSDDARVHFLQAHLSQNCNGSQDSQYIYVEQPRESLQHMTASASNTSDISSLLSANAQQVDLVSFDDSELPWKYLGSIGRDDLLKVSRDSSNDWSRFSTLSDALQIAEHKGHLLSAYLATLLAYSYAISTSLHRNVFPTAKDYVYYRTSPGLEPRQTGDWILSPYLDFGIGSRPRPISTSVAGIRFASDNAVFALGLLLHQVGLWKSRPEWNLEVDQSSFAARKRAAVDDMASLTREMGLKYHDIVKRCLIWSRDARSLEQGVEFRQLEGVFNDLYDYSMEVQGKVFG